MERKINTPICLSDRIYAYVEENKIRYQFLMVASTITEFIPVRYPIYKVNLPVLVKVYIPETLSHKEMEERKENKFFYENGVHLNQTYVRDDSFDNLKIAKGVFADYKKLKIVSASNSPIIIEEGAFADDARIMFVCPKDFELRVVSHKWKYWRKNNTPGKKEHRYAIIGNKQIFNDIDGFLSHNKDEYSFVPIDSMKLPKISVNTTQMVNGSEIVDIENPLLKDINNKNFSFTRLLSKDDIIDLLQRNNLKLDPNSEHGNLFGRTSEDGKYTIVAQCKYIKDPYENEGEIHDLSETAMFKDIPIFKDLHLSKKYSLFNRPEMIVIKDFYMTEFQSLKSEKEAQEYVLGLTNVYYDFMVEKFGNTYVEKAQEYFKENKESDKTSNEKK